MLQCVLQDCRRDSRTSTGRAYPLGPTVTPEGTTSPCSPATPPRLPRALRRRSDARPAASLELDPRRNEPATRGTSSSTASGRGTLRLPRRRPVRSRRRAPVQRPQAPLRSVRSRALSGTTPREHALYGYDRSSPIGDLSFSTSDSAPYTIRSMVLAPSVVDWEDDHSPRVPLHESVIYEVHVKGFTAHPSSAVSHPGTYLGLIEKIRTCSGSASPRSSCCLCTSSTRASPSARTRSRDACFTTTGATHPGILRPRAVVRRDALPARAS